MPGATLVVIPTAAASVLYVWAVFDAACTRIGKHLVPSLRFPFEDSSRRLALLFLGGVVVHESVHRVLHVGFVQRGVGAVGWGSR